MRIPNRPNPEAPYFNKGKRYYKIGFYVFIWVFLFPQFTKLLSGNAIIVMLSALLLVIPALGEYVLVPMAIINLIKSYKHKEPYNKYRAFYLIVLFVIMMVLLFFVVAVANDIGKVRRR